MNNRLYRLATLTNPQVPKTGYSRLKALENKGISVSWNPAITAASRQNKPEKSLAQNSLKKFHSVRCADESYRPEKRGKTVLRLLRGHWSISPRFWGGSLRRLLHRWHQCVHGYFRVTEGRSKRGRECAFAAGLVARPACTTMHHKF